MAKKMTKVGLSLACVAALGAAQLAPIAVPVFGYTSVKAESPAEDIVAVVVKGIDDSGELLSGPAVTIHPESESYTVVAEDIEGYTPVSYLVLAQSFLWETRGSGNEVTFSHQDAFSRGETLVDVIFTYAQNESQLKSPEEAPTPPPTDNQPGQPTPPAPPSADEQPGQPTPPAPPSPDEQPGQPIPPAPPSADEQPGQPTSPTPAPKSDGAEAGKEEAKPSTNPTSAQAVPATQESEKATSSSSKTLPNTGDVTVEPLALTGLGLFLASLGLRHLKKELD